jgi:hypothetical protein
MSGVCSGCLMRNYNTVIFDTDGDIKRESDAPPKLPGQQVDGSCFTQSTTILANLSRSQAAARRVVNRDNKSGNATRLFDHYSVTGKALIRLWELATAASRC